MDANAHFNSVSSNIGWFNRIKGKYSSIPHYKIRISIILMHLQSKMTSEICPRKGGLDDKTKQNRLTTFPPFFSQKTLYLLKNEKY